MVKTLRGFVLMMVVLALPGQAVTLSGDTEATNGVLDGFHKAAGEGDWPRYFSLMAKDGIFLGTDITERWTKAEFEAYASTRPTGWVYTPKRRNISFTPDGNTAFFDEVLLSEKYGYCRGTGVLIRTNGGWKISQYHLTFPIPNDVFSGITKQFQGLVKKQIEGTQP